MGVFDFSFVVYSLFLRDVLTGCLIALSDFRFSINVQMLVLFDYFFFYESSELGLNFTLMKEVLLISSHALNSIVKQLKTRS